MRGLLVLIILLALVTSSTAIAVPGTVYSVDSQVSVEINPNSELLGIVYDGKEVQIGFYVQPLASS